MRQINPHAKMALLLGIFLGVVVFTIIYLLTEGERIIVASIFSLVPLVLLLCLAGNFFDPGPPE